MTEDVTVCSPIRVIGQIKVWW